MLPRTPENLVRHELIGLPVTVVESTDESREGIQGQVVDETRNMVTIQTGAGDEAALAKDECVFRFELDDVSVTVDGALLVARPEERILKKFPRKWEYND